MTGALCNMSIHCRVESSPTHAHRCSSYASLIFYDALPDMQRVGIKDCWCCSTGWCCFLLMGCRSASLFRNSRLPEYCRYWSAQRQLRHQRYISAIYDMFRPYKGCMRRCNTYNSCFCRAKHPDARSGTPRSPVECSESSGFSARPPPTFSYEAFGS